MNCKKAVEDWNLKRISLLNNYLYLIFANINNIIQEGSQWTNMERACSIGCWDKTIFVRQFAEGTRWSRK